MEFDVVENHGLQGLVFQPNHSDAPFEWAVFYPFKHISIGECNTILSAYRIVLHSPIDILPFMIID